MKKLAKTYPCPVCGKPLTKSEFEKALEIHSAKEKHLQDLENDLRKKERRLKEDVARAIEAGQKAGEKKEKRRAERLMAGQKRHIKKLEERITQLEKGTTPQTDGLEFEEKLLSRLKKEFQGFGDDIQRKGKLVGDIVHIVRYEGKDAGKIIYECKRTPKISGKHVQQTYQAKQSAHADFAVLVTTGRKRGFGGLMTMDGVLVVAPLGVIPLATLLRTNLIEMLRSKVTQKHRAKVAQQLLKYITSPQLRNPIEEVIHLSSNLQDMVKEEFDDHVDVWKKRLLHYQKINWDGSQVQSNLRLILHGKEPKTLVQPKLQALLPAVNGR